MALNSQTPLEQNRPLSPPPSIPDHELLRCIGSGSYGEVWLARNIMGTYRAVKVVYRGTFSDARPFEREFQGMENFEPVSRSHDGFIDILQVGSNEKEGYYYCVMELADDVLSGRNIDPDKYQPRTLVTALEEHGRLSFEESVRIGASLAAALHHLHQHGLIHRDIKPSNIVFVNGIPKIADIGLVAEAGMSHSIVGTEGFMPPEGPGSPQADIYSLGKVLYEISTGQDRKAFPELPETVDKSGVEGFAELNEVFLRACERDTTRRYRNAGEMHRDLLLLQAGQSVKRLRVLERRMVYLKKGAAIAAIIAVVVGGVIYQINRELKMAAERRQQQVGRSVAYGTRFIDEGDYFGALPFFVEALSLDSLAPAAQEMHRVRIATTLARCPGIENLWFLNMPVNAAKLSPNGEYLLIVGERGAVVQELKQGSPPRILPGKDLEGAAFNKDGSLALTAGAGGISLWDTTNWQLLRSIPQPGWVYSAEFSPDDTQIATASWVEGSGFVHLWETGTGKHLGQIAHTPPGENAEHRGFRSTAFSPDGKYLAFCGENNMAQVCSLETRQLIGAPIKHRGWVFAVNFSSDGRQLVTASYDGTVQLSDWKTGRLLIPPMKHPAGVKTAEFSPDGRYLVAAGWDFTARMWRVKDGQAIHPFLKQNGKHLMYAAFKPDGRRIVTANANGVITLWDLARASSPEMLPVEQNPEIDRYAFVESNRVSVISPPGNDLITRVVPGLRIQDARLNWDGSHLLTISVPAPENGSEELIAQVWKAEDGTAVSKSFPLAGTDFADKLRGDWPRIWNSSEAVVVRAPTQTANIQPAFLSPDGEMVGMARGDSVFLWKWREGIQPHEYDLGEEAGYATFSPDGQVLVVCGASVQTLFERSAHLWDVPSATRIAVPLRHADGVNHAAFSFDGSRLVTASEDGTARVWEVHTGRALTPPLRHKAQVSEACFSPDGQWIATSCQDRTARIWDAQTGEPVTPPLPHPYAFQHVQFAAHGRALITRSTDGKSANWPLTRNDYPAPALARLAQILSGHQNDYTGGQLPQEPEELRMQWETLRTAQRDYFTESPRAVLAWHQREAESSEQEENWGGALFHWKQLLEASPENSSFKTREAVAQQHLGAERANPTTSTGE